MNQILIVDDSKSIHAFLKDCFTGSQTTLTHALNGQLALDELEKAATQFQLILLDWEMPVLDGPTTYSQIRKKGIQIPIIMMTSRNSIQDISSMIDVGAAEYIMKPFTKDILFEKIGSVLNGGI